MRLLPFPGVFQPNSDSWMLADCLGDERLGVDTRVLDVCSGSGMLAVSAALRGAAHVSAVDVSRRAVTSIRLHARLNGVRVRALRGDLFAPVGGERFDLIISNPPYVPNEGDLIPRRGPSRAWEAGRSGRRFIDRICGQAAAHLRPGGRLLIVHSSVCGERATLEALSAGGLDAHVAARRRGPLGPRLAARARWLHREGMLLADGGEELIVFRAA